MSDGRTPLGRRRQLWLMDRQEEAVARIASERRSSRSAMAAACGMPIGALATSTLLTTILPHGRAQDVERTYGLPSGTLHPLAGMPNEETAGFDADPRLRYLLDAIVERDDARVDAGPLLDRLSELSDQGVTRAQCARAVGVDYQRFSRFKTSRTRTAPRWLAERVAAALDGPARREGLPVEPAASAEASTATAPQAIVFDVVDDATVRVVVAARTSRLGAERLTRLLGPGTAHEHTIAGQWVVRHNGVVPTAVADAVRAVVAPDGTRGAMIDDARRRERRGWFRRR